MHADGHPASLAPLASGAHGCVGLGPAGSVAECSVVFGTSATVDGAASPLSQCDSLMFFVFWSCPLTSWV